MKFRKKKPKRGDEITGLLSPEEEDPVDDEDSQFEENIVDTEVIKDNGDLLRIHLQHGDILIQQGFGLQIYYEASPSISVLM
jgi:hypothetical protein